MLQHTRDGRDASQIVVYRWRESSSRVYRTMQLPPAPCHQYRGTWCFVGFLRTRMYVGPVRWTLACRARADSCEGSGTMYYAGLNASVGSSSPICLSGEPLLTSECHLSCHPDWVCDSELLWKSSTHMIPDYKRPSHGRKHWALQMRHYRGTKQHGLLSSSLKTCRKYETALDARQPGSVAPAGP
jgi:hypothetical protein